MSKLIDRTGETRTSNQGYKMTIIKYTNNKDINVLFEDGTVVKHAHYESFLKRTIRNPNHKVGEISVSKTGLTMRIIQYVNCENVDVQFESGYIARNRTYKDFKEGNIKDKSVGQLSLNERLRKERIGETSVTTSGRKMKIIAYRNTRDIDIQFEDGIVVSGKSYENFKKGIIPYPLKEILRY